MSNSAVVRSPPPTLHLTRITVDVNSQGQTYDTIIEDTIKGSQQDFIEAGVSLDYLEALRTVSHSLKHTQLMPFRYGNLN